MPKLTPNYLTVDAAGNVVAKFTGGLVLPIRDNAFASTATAVTWTKLEDGSVVAQVAATRQSISPPLSDGLTATVQSPNAAHSAQLSLEAANARNGGNPASRVVASVENASFGETIIDSDNNSSLLRNRIAICTSASVGAGNPNAVLFNVPKPGNYLITVGMSAFASAAAGQLISRHLIDNIAQADLTFFANQVGIGVWMGEVSWTQFLTAGAHGYGWVSPGGVALGYDVNSRHNIWAIG